MKITMNKAGFLTIILVSIALFATCEFTKQIAATDNPIETADTVFLSQWRREKLEKVKLIGTYEAKLTKLQKDNDSLKKVVADKKENLAAYRLKEKILQEQLKSKVSKADTGYAAIARDSIPQIVDSLLLASQQNDTACDETIHELENQVANRDSAIFLHKRVEINLRDLQEEQQLQNRYLTEKLNTVFKNQRKKSRQNRILAGGLLILSGITSSVLLTQSLK